MSISKEYWYESFDKKTEKKDNGTIADVHSYYNYKLDPIAFDHKKEFKSKFDGKPEFFVESSYNGNKYNLDRPKVDYTIHYKSKDFIPDSYYEFNLTYQNLVIFLSDVPVHQIF